MSVKQMVKPLAQVHKHSLPKLTFRQTPIEYRGTLNSNDWHGIGTGLNCGEKNNFHPT